MPTPTGLPPSSALSEAVSRVGDRWSLLIVEALLAGPMRFSQLQETVAGIAPNILSQRLKHLEREGVLASRPYSRRPPRDVYELTAQGSDLAGTLRLLAHWGAGGSEGAETPRHEACGTPMDARWYCPTCARAVDEPSESSVSYI